MFKSEKSILCDCVYDAVVSVNKLTLCVVDSGGSYLICNMDLCGQKLDAR